MTFQIATPAHRQPSFPGLVLRPLAALAARFRHALRGETATGADPSARETDTLSCGLYPSSDAATRLSIRAGVRAGSW